MFSRLEKMSINLPETYFFKPFSSETGTMVALFTSDYGWIKNLPAHEVFCGDLPPGIAFEEMYPIQDFPAEQFNKGLAPTPTNDAADTPASDPPTTIAIGSIIINTAVEMNLPTTEMCDFTREIFRKMRIQLSAGNSLDSSFVSANSSEAMPKGWIFQFK